MTFDFINGRLSDCFWHILYLTLLHFRLVIHASDNNEKISELLITIIIGDTYSDSAACMLLSKFNNKHDLVYIKMNI